jgi:phosphoglycolate phosphatase
MKETTDSIIFDLDGTLWDSTATIAEAWQTAIDELGVIDKRLIAEDIKKIAGMPYDAIYDKLFLGIKGKDRENLQSLCARYEIEFLVEKGGNLYEGLSEVLTYLKESDYTLAIVSNCQQGYIEAFLEHHKLGHFFTDHECYGSRNLPKFENIKTVVNRSSLGSAIYVGDTASDHEASVKAKLPFVYASYGFGTVEEAELVINKLTDLQQLF